ncbi:hypothetical protein [Brevundimonas sp.]|uniref:hypothetical protein n=1 Tax=Brevundimonas sp. TaxID=1871086 RepID=UPI003D0A17D6
MSEKGAVTSLRPVSDTVLWPRLPPHRDRRYQPIRMIDVERKKAILKAEQEFERKENLSRALAEKGVTLIGAITSPAQPVDEPPGDAADTAS